jgi:hypothetical protein
MYKWIKKIKGGRAFATRFFDHTYAALQKELKQMAQSLAQINKRSFSFEHTLVQVCRGDAFSLCPPSLVFSLASRE